MDNLIKQDQVFAAGYGYEYSQTTGILKFTVPVDPSRKLNVEARYGADGQLKEKLLWQIVPAKKWKKDNEVQLFKP